MWNPFKKKCLLPDEDYLFQIETYKWLLRNFGGDVFYKETPLVLPTEEFFPEMVDTPEDAARITFRYVKKYAGMDDWPCKLVAQKPDPERKVAPTVVIQGDAHGPLGTFSAKKGNKVTITYNPALASDPMRLVATFAHELAHYLTGTCKKPPPGGWDNWEFATDIAAVFMGFGIFMANSAFSFSQFTDIDSIGWSTSRSGYLSEAEFAFSLAIFLKLKEIDPKSVYPFLKPNIKSYLKKGLKELADSQAWLALNEIQSTSEG